MTASLPVRPVATRRASRAAAVAVLVVAALLTGAGCAATASAEVGEPAPQVTHPGGEISFGSAYEYADGLFLQVKDPVKFTPTAQAEWDREVDGVPVRIAVSVTNGTRDDFTPHALTAVVVSDGVEAEPILDPGLQIGLTGPSVRLRPAGVAKFELAFLVADPDDVTLTVVPALGGYDPIVVTD